MSKLPEYQTIIYATDLGDHMRPVFRHAVHLAESNHAQIIMLHVAEPLTATGQAIVEAYLPAAKIDQFNREGLHSIIERMQQRLARLCEDETGLCPDDSNLVSDVVVVQGLPADEISRRARQYQADLIVMGSCSHGVLGQASLGSTTRRVVQASTIPVLIVPNCRS